MAVGVVPAGGGHSTVSPGGGAGGLEVWGRDEVDSRAGFVLWGTSGGGGT